MNSRVQLLQNIKDNKSTKFEQFAKGYSRYCGGDCECNSQADAKYNPDIPDECNIKIDSKAHAEIPDFQLPLNMCPLCNGNIYLCRFNNEGLNENGFGYKTVDMNYYCKNCSLEFHVWGSWD